VRGRDGGHAEPRDQLIEPIAIGVHVGELGPEQGKVREHRRDVRQVERGRLLGKEPAVAVLVIVAVGKAVAGEQHALARVEAPPGRAQVADHGLDRDQTAATEIDAVALLHPAHAMLVLRERQVIVADIAAQDGLGKAREDAAEPPAMRRLLVSDEQIFQRRRPAREQLGEMALDDRKVLRVAGLDQDRRGLARDQEGGVVAVIDPALVALREAVADPEHAGRDLARHRMGHVSALLVTADIARGRHALVQAL